MSDVYREPLLSRLEKGEMTRSEILDLQTEVDGRCNLFPSILISVAQLLKEKVIASETREGKTFYTLA